MNKQYENFKPQYIFVNQNNDVVINKNNFEKMIREAWEEGYAAGKRDDISKYLATTTTPSFSDNITYINKLPCLEKYSCSTNNQCSSQKSKNNVKVKDDNLSEYAFLEGKNIDNQSNELYCCSDAPSIDLYDKTVK